MKTPIQIIKEAIKDYNPVHAILLFSGGHDSVVSTYVSASILTEIGFPFHVYHGDTTISIKETQDYVKEICRLNNWPLEIRRPPDPADYYENIVKEYGFPGPTKKAHQFMYRRLKERALRHHVTHEIKSSPSARENVLLLTGVRKDESEVRMAYLHEVQKDDSRIWVNPIFWWSKIKCEKYMEENDIPRNKVKDLICISGECLCGAFADSGEKNEIDLWFPEAGKEIDRLHEITKDNGHPWPWSSGPTDWFKLHPPGQIEIDHPSFMCVGCMNKRKAIL